MSSTIPYIGSKISLISNSEIRYEGILYTINTQESTIALQSVKTFGTEGRKIPEIPPSSEIYDFIIFRGQDIKDLTVLEGAQNPSSPMLSDPAIMSMNQRPAGGPGKGKDGPKGSEAKGGGKASQSKGSGGYDKGYDRSYDKGGSSGWNNHSYKGSGKGMSDYSKGSGKHDGWGSKGRSDTWGYSKGGGRSDDWGYSKGGGKWDDSSKGKGASSYKGAIKGGKSKDIQASEKGGKGKGKSPGKGGKDSGSKGKKGESKGDRGGNRRTGGATGGSTSAVPVGELLPEENAAVKKECAEDFDVTAANTKFDKVTETTEPGESTAKPLTGYDKTKSFFDNISCEATDRATDTDRPKVDRDKARQFDRETFGDTRRPPRPVGIRRGNGKGKGGGKGGYQS